MVLFQVFKFIIFRVLEVIIKILFLFDFIIFSNESLYFFLVFERFPMVSTQIQIYQILANFRPFYLFMRRNMIVMPNLSEILKDNCLLNFIIYFNILYFHRNYFNQYCLPLFLLNFKNQFDYNYFLKNHLNEFNFNIYYFKNFFNYY